MDRRAGAPRAAIGFTVKSGWAAAVLLAGSPASFRIVDSSRIDLSDPAVPESRQPYHEGFGTARAAGPELTRLLRSVRRFGERSVAGLIERYCEAGHRLAGAGVVVGSLIDPAQIANDHIRIHALEGQLFRGIVEEGAVRSRVPCAIWRERDLYASAAGVLDQSEQRLRARLAVRPPDVGGSWRAEQKAAALAAWLVLAGRP
jgi:hypothetical protein